MDWTIFRNKERFWKISFRVFLVLMGILIIIFNDAFGDSETFGIFGFLYFLLLFFLFCRWVFRQIKSIIRLKNEKTKAELMHLKSQVNPHFFFNMLNNLYGLVDKDSKKAKTLILKLSDMMRYSIYEGEKETVPLSDEIEYLQNYIELHKMRYHKAIEVKFDLQIEEEDYQIMPLLFIILLENAFKHGVENLRKNAYVHIQMRAINKEVYFEIENNFDASEQETQGGIGLKNLNRRLELVYPKRHHFSYAKTNDVYKAELRISLGNRKK